MRLLDKIIAVFDRSTRLRMGAVRQQGDLIEYVYRIHVQTFQRLTGKTPTRYHLPSVQRAETDIPGTSRSLVRRLTRPD